MVLEFIGCALDATTWNKLLSGLLGAVIGSAVGAIIGFFASSSLQRRTEANLQKGAGRAVLAEMFTNADRAIGAESTGRVHAFFDEAWRGQLSLVVQRLNWPNLRKLISAYDSAARAYDNAIEEIQKLDERERKLHAQPQKMGEELQRDEEFGEIERNRQKISAWFVIVAQEWVDAIDVLAPAVLETEERQTFEEDFARIRRQLRSANLIRE
jgi:hypothetical protein